MNRLFSSTCFILLILLVGQSKASVRSLARLDTVNPLAVRYSSLDLIANIYFGDQYEEAVPVRSDFYLLDRSLVEILKAAEVSISGRVITAQTAGLNGALVTLTDARGNSRTILTRKSGDFQFDAVAAGETYVLSVASKRYRYAAQIVSVTENLTGLSFAPQ